MTDDSWQLIERLGEKLQAVRKEEELVSEGLEDL
jgi:hypothetical protein